MIDQNKAAKEVVVEKFYKQLYDYFYAELAKCPGTYTKFILEMSTQFFNTEESSKILMSVSGNSLFNSVDEKRAIARIALRDVWFCIPKLTKEYLDRTAPKPVGVEVPKAKRGPKPKVETPNAI